MKKNTLFFLLFILMNFRAYSEFDINETKKLGMISYLTSVKSIAEFKMTTLIADPQYKTSSKTKGFQSKYNILKLTVDRLINQMSADMISKNKIKLYKSLNKYVKGEKTDLPTKLLEYKKLLNQIDDLYTAFSISTYADTKGGASVEEITGIVELGYTAFKDQRELNEKRVSNINLILKDLKLASLKDFTEEKEKRNLKLWNSHT